MLVIRFVIGLALIALIDFLMALGAGAFMAVPDIITLLIFTNLVDMEVLANLWGWERSSVMSLLLMGFGSIFFLAMSDFDFLANIIGGLIGIVAGILTMGIFVTGVADALLQIVTLPALDVGAVFFIVVFFFLML